MMISSLRPNYLHLLNSYNKILEQRNNYLRQIKLENKNPCYRLKRGEVLEITNDSCLLEIETVNIVSDDGFSTLIGVVYPHGYEKIWFKKDELEKFEIYDENGNIQ